jgi:N-acetylneuraminate synthase
MKGIIMNRVIQIADRQIGQDFHPFIIAEMSGNHNQSLTRALEIVEAAAQTGVDAVKLQTYTAETMTINLAEREFFIDDPSSLWQGKSLYELYEEAHTPWDWHESIIKRCKEHGLICFSTPFDETAVDFLESLDVPAYKIASFENNHLPLIKKVAETGKPMLISTGMASLDELYDAVKTASEAGCKDLILLKCTSSYPASPENSNLMTIPHMNELFGCQVGLSDHTLGIGAAIASIVLGATVIEKHFTLNRQDGGVDSAFSLEPEEMKTLVAETKRAWQALGQVKYGGSKGENSSKVFRRSLYVVQDMKAGNIFTTENLRIIRPGYGLSPKHYDFFIGRRISKDVKRGTPVSWDLI